MVSEQLKFKLNSPNSRLAIVAHDAGGAEILSSYVRRHALNPLYLLDGPALRIFERKLGPVTMAPMKEILDQATLLLCGTSWQSDLEFNVIKIAQGLMKPTIVFLDHWVSYHERFTRNGETFLPDQIWVGDIIAEEKAKEIFPEHPIFLEENPYFLDIHDELELLCLPDVRGCSELSILYVCEPIKEHAKLRYGDERYWGYIEEEALRYFLTNISILGRPIKRIQIRPHPSETKDKYNWVQHEFQLPIEKGGSDTLLAEIVANDVVVGCESMAMVVGLLAQKRVVSCIPPGGRDCVLPQPEIEWLQNLVKEKGL